MIQVDILEAINDLSRLIKLLETKQEDVIYLAKDGTAVAQITLIPPKLASRRIGVAENEADGAP